ncbi:putative ubiquitin-conjugating enzyme E2 25 [Raphanus sativus]|nr:putative ubiquitin-conjugating enzyme E2 25 [Raphanus sativus]
MEPEIASCSQTLTPNQVDHVHCPCLFDVGLVLIAATPEANGVEQYEGVVNNNTVDNKNKGKAIQLGDDDEGSASDIYDTTNNDESYPGSSPLSNSLLDPDSLIYEDDDDYSDQYGYEMEDELEEEDDYVSEYQAIFDAKEKDIPAGVEVAMDWLPNSEAGKSGKCSRDEHGIKPEAPSSSSKKATTGSGIHSAPPVAQPWNALPHNAKGVIPNSAYALPLKSQTYHYSAAQAFKFSSSSGQLEPQTPDTVMGEAPVLATAPSGLVLPVPNNPSWYKGHKMYPHARPRVEEVIAGQSSSRVKRNMEDYLGKYLFFKKFDIVEDLGDHEYAAQGTTVKQHSKEWMKRIQEEWRILENDLPEMIFVRAYESRMDLMRAVIVGADGTPYHDGLFFFDIFFPDTYPSVPPYFEDFSYGHFFSCAHDVLRACTAYRNGALVASLVRGKVKEGEESSERCSEKFSQDVGNIVDTLLLKEFILLGVLGLEPEEEGKASETNVAESSDRPPRGGMSSS